MRLAPGRIPYPLYPRRRGPRTLTTSVNGVDLTPTKPKPNTRWSEPADHYEEWKLSTLNGGRFEFCARRPLDAFFVADPPWGDIEISDIVTCQRRRLATGPAKASVRNELRMLMAVQNHGLTMGILDQSYYTKWSVKELLGEIPSNPYRPWSEAEYEAFTKHLPGWCRRVVEFAWLTGFRRRQIERMEWGTHLDLGRQLVRPIRQKKGLQIEFNFSVFPVLAELIHDQRDWALAEGYPVDRGFVFRRPSEVGPGRRRRTDRLVNCRNEWDAAMTAAKLDLPEFGRDLPGFRSGLAFHGLRANLVTRLLGLGVQPAVICRLTGHKTLSMIQAYNHPGDDQFADAMMRLDRDERARRERRHLKVV